MSGLSHTDRPEDYFLHPQAYPLIRIPFWLLETAGAPRDDDFAEGLVYAALSGYYYLRLLDNLMDGHETVERTILPAANFFQIGAQQPFAAHFAHGHPFWERYRAWWLQFAEATWRDGGLASIDRDAFETQAANKTCPEKILIAAACFRSGREDLLAGWCSFAEAFGRWHQMGDDLRDWALDHEDGRVTYFLSEAVRAGSAGEAVPAWVAGGGYRWGADRLAAYHAEAERSAAALGCPGLVDYLAARKALSDRQTASALGAFRSLAGLKEILDR
jgi:hypothetical protein